MKMKHLTVFGKSVVVAGALAVATSAISADDDSTDDSDQPAAFAPAPAKPKHDATVYAGGGSDAFVIGALFDRGASVAWGVDFAQEGLMTDRTGGSAGVFYDYVPNDTENAYSSTPPSPTACRWARTRGRSCWALCWVPALRDANVRLGSPTWATPVTRTRTLT